LGKAEVSGWGHFRFGSFGSPYLHSRVGQALLCECRVQWVVERTNLSRPNLVMDKKRLITSILLILSIVFILSVCSTSKVRIETPQVSTSDVETPSIIFEIWIERDGSVPIREKSLLFRLLSDQTVEFDYEVAGDHYEDGIKNRIDYSVKRSPRIAISEKETVPLRWIINDNPL
jgi:biopolymer transport protein ExbD